MISDVPTPKDFFDSGIELFDFAWDTVANLITKFSDAINYGVEEADVSEDYLAASKRRLTTALAMTQQGVEFILKGKIAEVSPFLLLAEGPSKWPSPYLRRAGNKLLCIQDGRRARSGSTAPHGSQSATGQGLCR